MLSFGRVRDKLFDLSFNFRGEQGSGKMASEVRDIGGFTGVDVGGVFQVEITAQKDFSVEVEADDNLLPLIKTNVQGGVLKIATACRLSTSNPIRVRIYAPDIESLDVSGAANVTVSGLKNSDLSVGSSGASKIKLAGETIDLKIDVSGASKVDGEELWSENATVDASGASHVSVNVTSQLRGDASGASKIVYSGSPGSVEKKSSGASSVSPK
jgi:hypothetical protein